MKKLLTSLLAVTLVVLFATAALAAVGTIAVNSDTVYADPATNKPSYRVIVFTITAGTGGDINTFTGTSTILETTTGITKGALTRWYLYKVSINPGATGPTDNLSNLFINDADGIDLLGGNGAAILDNTSSLATVPATFGQNMPQPITGTLTIATTGNAVESSVMVVTMILASRPS